MDDQKPGKRIVSREEYVKAYGQKGIIASFGGVLLLITSALTLLTMVGTLLTVNLIFMQQYMAFFTLIVTCTLGIMAFHVGEFAMRTLRRAREIDPGIPRTRCNAADLSVEDTLVRASAAPVEQQQAILLRAASESDTTPAEQLVRPYSGNDA